MISDFKELIPDILDSYYVSDYFHVRMYDNCTPHEGTKYEIDGKVYEVTFVQDDTDIYEREQGLRYSLVTFMIVED